MSTIYLRAIDINALLTSYVNREFMSHDKLLEVKPSENNVNKTVVSSRDRREIKDVICVGDRYYGQEYIDHVKETGNHYNCMTCLQQIKKDPLGVPIKRWEKDGSIYYNCVDVFCTFGCVVEEISTNSKRRALYAQSYSFIAEIYSIATGKSLNQLPKIRDTRLLKVYNGPLSYEEFHDNGVYYSDTPQIKIIPVEEYIKRCTVNGDSV